MPPIVIYSEARRLGFGAHEARQKAHELTQLPERPFTVFFYSCLGVSAVSGLGLLVSMLFN